MQKEIEVEVSDIVEQYESIIEEQMQEYINYYLVMLESSKDYDQMVRDTLESEIGKRSNMISKYMQTYLFNEPELKQIEQQSEVLKYDSEHFKAKIQEINGIAADQTNYIKTDLINKELQAYADNQYQEIQKYHQKAQQQNQRLAEIRDMIIKQGNIDGELKAKIQLKQQSVNSQSSKQ